MKAKKKIKYPVKLGYNDNSGKDENIITDANDNTVVYGWGDCCRIGGIQQQNVALAIIRCLNECKPNMYLEVIVDEGAK